MRPPPRVINLPQIEVLRERDPFAFEVVHELQRAINEDRHFLAALYATMDGPRPAGPRTVTVTLLGTRNRINWTNDQSGATIKAYRVWRASAGSSGTPTTPTFSQASPIITVLARSRESVPAQGSYEWYDEPATSQTDPLRFAYWVTSIALIAGEEVESIPISGGAAVELLPLGPTVVAFASGTLTLIAQPAADTELPATNWRLKLDLSAFTQFRVTCRVATAGAAGADLRFQGSTDDSTFGSLDGAAGPEVAIGTTGEKDSGWVTLATTYRVASVRLRMMGKDGDGVASPVVNQIVLHFR